MSAVPPLVGPGFRTAIKAGVVLIAAIPLLFVVLRSVGGPGESTPAVASQATVSIEGLSFVPSDIDVATVYVQPGLDPALQDRLTASIRTAMVEAPQLLGAEPLPGTDYYLLSSSNDFRRALQQVGGIRPELIGANETGHSLSTGRHPGIYINAAAQDEDGKSLWLIAHEITHQVERQLAGGRPIPQWFNEGVAELNGGMVGARAYPAYSARHDFTVGARLASTAHTGSLPVLSPLRTQAEWVSSTKDGTAAYYAAAALAVSQLIGDQGMAPVARIFAAMAEGTSFDAAFEATFNQPPESVDAMIQGYITSDLVTSFPVGLTADRPALPIAERIQLVYVGLKPNEDVSWTFNGPGTCSGRGTSPGTGEGFTSFYFFVRPESQARCAGGWTATAAGDQGASGRYQFRFTSN